MMEYGFFNPKDIKGLCKAPRDKVIQIRFDRIISTPSMFHLYITDRHVLSVQKNKINYSQVIYLDSCFVTTHLNEEIKDDNIN